MPSSRLELMRSSFVSDLSDLFVRQQLKYAPPDMAPMHTVPVEMVPHELLQVTTYDDAIYVWDVRAWKQRHWGPFVLVTSGSSQGVTVTLASNAEFTEGIRTLQPSLIPISTQVALSFLVIPADQLELFDFLRVRIAVADDASDDPHWFLLARFQEELDTTWSVSLSDVFWSEHSRTIPLMQPLIHIVPSGLSDRHLPLRVTVESKTKLNIVKTQSWWSPFVYTASPVSGEELVLTGVNSFRTRFHHSSPPDGPHMWIWLHPGAEYEVRVRLDWPGVLGELLRSYQVTLLSCLMVLWLLITSQQLFLWTKSGVFPPFGAALVANIESTFVWVVVFAVFSSWLGDELRVWGFFGVDKDFAAHFSPPSSSLFVNLGLYLVSLAILLLVYVLIGGLFFWTRFILRFVPYPIHVLMQNSRLASASAFPSAILIPFVILALLLHPILTLTVITVLFIIDIGFAADTQFVEVINYRKMIVFGVFLFILSKVTSIVLSIGILTQETHPLDSSFLLSLPWIGLLVLSRRHSLPRSNTPVAFVTVACLYAALACQHLIYRIPYIMSFVAAVFCVLTVYQTQLSDKKQNR
eukprot:GILK01006779.1.p1 GENE.GILK01006779.1~~GILK01006779.1.p1  ORF type:complete len:655 (+),score=52.34 GILK01006779.1:227-1966(+)